MRTFLFIALLAVLSGCSHWKWVMKHQDEVCAKCPQNIVTESEQTDTVVWGDIPADTIIIRNTERDTIFVDNTQYKIIRVAGETKVIIKDRRIPITITKFRDRNVSAKVTTLKEKYTPWYIYCLFPILILVGWMLRQLLVR